MSKRYIIPIASLILLGIVIAFHNSNPNLKFTEVKEDIEELHHTNQQMYQLTDSIGHINEIKSEKITRLDSLNILKDLTIEEQNDHLKQMVIEAEDIRDKAEKARDEAIKSKKLAEEYREMAIQAERISKEYQIRAEQAYDKIQEENHKLQLQIKELETKLLDALNTIDTIRVIPIIDYNEKNKKRKNTSN